MKKGSLGESWVMIALSLLVFIIALVILGNNSGILDSAKEKIIDLFSLW